MLTTLLAAITGAAAQEVMYWLGQRKRLDVDAFEAMCRSRANWWITLAVVLVSGAVAFFWYFNVAKVDPRDAMLFGAAVPALFKQLLTAAAPSSVALGSHGAPYFRTR